MQIGVLIDDKFGIMEGDDLAVLPDDKFSAIKEITLPAKNGEWVTAPVHRLRDNERFHFILKYLRTYIDDIPHVVFVDRSYEENLFVDLDVEDIEKPKVEHEPDWDKLLNLSFVGRVCYLSELGWDARQIAYYLEATGLNSDYHMLYEVGRAMYLINRHGWKNIP